MAKRVPQIDWKKCVICQKTSREKLLCPERSKRLDKGIGIGYSTLISNIESFNEVCDPSLYFDLSKFDQGNGALQTLTENSGKWHRSCRSQYDVCKIEREKRKRIPSESEGLDSNVIDLSEHTIRTSSRKIAL